MTITSVIRAVKDMHRVIKKIAETTLRISEDVTFELRSDG